MKMNAFLRLIRTIACGVVVLGAAGASLGQVNETVTVSGTLLSVDDNGDDVDNADSGKSHAVGQSQTPVADVTSGSPAAQMYYPPGMEIPLTETEIPGSSYFVGPNGERIDASSMMNQVPAGQEFEIQDQNSLQGLSSGQSFSPEGVYDGTLAFPMGTFPTTPFGERILSEVPAGDSKEGESQSSEIEGALVDDNGRPVDGAAGDEATPGMENGVPVDEVIRPDNSPVAENLEVAEVEDSDATNQAAKGNDRLEQRLKEAEGEKARLGGKLSNANKIIDVLTKEVSKSVMTIRKANKELKDSKAKLQVSLGKLKDVEAEKKKLVEQMESAKNDSQADSDKKMKGLEKKLTQVQRRHKERLKEMQSAAREEQKKMKSLLSDKDKAMKKAKAAQEELAETKAQMAAKLADAEAAVVQAKAETTALTKKLAAGAAGAAAGIAAMGKNSIADTAAATANAASEAKAAAELEVKRRLEKAKQAKKAALDAEDASVEEKEDKADGDDVLSLDDQIKRLKAKRDQQIAESETRIRAKQQREIDKLLEEGKAVDSDEVKAAVDKMKEAIKTSEEKLRSRFLRRLDRLKEDMKKSLK